MAVDMFLKIDAVKGESSDTEHKEEIDVLSWNWGMSQSGTTHIGGGGGAGKVNVQDMTVTKWVDASTPNLLKMCCKGTHFKEATMSVRKAGDNPLEYVKIIMHDGIISSIAGGGSGSDDRLTENISLNFSRVSYEYTPQKEDGSGKPSIPMSWNIAANTED